MGWMKRQAPHRAEKGNIRGAGVRDAQGVFRVEISGLDAKQENSFHCHANLARGNRKRKGEK